jgi:NAD+ synthase (glutamine-hydrolysing)
MGSPGLPCAVVIAMKMTLAQINPVIGDMEGNIGRMKAALERAKRDSSDLVIFPELSITGYPPLDLLERKWFLDKADKAVGKIRTISRSYPGMGIVIGAPRRDGKRPGALYNSAFLIKDGKVLSTHDKMLLPTYDVFDEDRYFESSGEVKVAKFGDEVLGISICEDMWYGHYPGYSCDPIAKLKEQGATILINISASPFHLGKDKERFGIVREHARKHKLPFVFVNQVGANDELIFDGCSVVVNSQGRLVKALEPFSEDIVTIDSSSMGKGTDFVQLGKMQSLRSALVLGVRDYVRKCGFSKAVVGLSGGIDSAVTAAIAAEALGPENVLGATMPSKYSSSGSVEDSRRLAENLGISFKQIPIGDIFNSYVSTMKGHFEGRKEDVTEENIQARIRGNVLMALSNKFGYLVLSTGNKSEASVGYCTLYGDMSGGLSVISDVPKTMVYELARHMNSSKREIIPKSTIEKEPSAELREGQKDQDSLPEYGILDKILELYVEAGLSAPEIVKKGFDKKTVEWVIKAVKRTEYKRRQAAPGLRVTTKAFGMGRKIPIATNY